MSRVSTSLAAVPWSESIASASLSSASATPLPGRRRPSHSQSAARLPALTTSRKSSSASL